MNRLSSTKGLNHTQLLFQKRRSGIIVTYALCGFAGLTASGVGIGVFTALVPYLASAITKMTRKALITATFAFT